MNIVEAFQSGQPFRRPDDTHWYGMIENLSTVWGAKDQDLHAWLVEATSEPAPWCRRIRAEDITANDWVLQEVVNANV